MGPPAAASDPPRGPALGKLSLDSVFAKLIAPRGYDRRPLGKHEGGKSHILGDDQISLLYPVDDGEVCCVSPLIDHDPFYPVPRRKGVAVVSNHDHRYPMPPGSLYHQIPPGSAIGIEIDLHKKSIAQPLKARPGVFPEEAESPRKKFFCFFFFSLATPYCLCYKFSTNSVRKGGKEDITDNGLREQVLWSALRELYEFYDCRQVSFKEGVQ